MGYVWSPKYLFVYTHIYFIYIHLYVCMYACTYVCRCVCMYLSTYLSIIYLFINLSSCLSSIIYQLAAGGKHTTHTLCFLCYRPFSWSFFFLVTKLVCISLWSSLNKISWVLRFLFMFFDRTLLCVQECLKYAQTVVEVLLSN